MQKALRRSDGKFWGGGGGRGGGGDGGSGKENSTPDSSGIANKLNNSLADVSATDKESIQLTKKNVLRPSQADADLTRVKKKNSSSTRMSTSSVHLRPRSLSPLMMASSPFVEAAPATNRSRHIRFTLPDSSSDSPSSLMNKTLTPPPKEFRRSDYKTLRATRCLSTIVTEKERAVLRDLEAERLMAALGQRVSSPRPPAGIVRSMCRFYNRKMGLDGNGVVAVNRSNSFGGGKTDVSMVVVVDHRQDSLSSSSASHSSDDASMSCPSLSGKASSVSPGSDPESAGGAGGGSSSGGVGKTSGFGLFRSRSWSLRRKRGGGGGGGGGAELKRCSPSYSTKSQDSGFSDTESKGHNNNNRVGGRSTAVVISSKSTRSTSTSMREEEEDGEDPNLTQMPSGQKTATATATTVAVTSVEMATRQKLVSHHVAHKNQLRQHQWLHHQSQHFCHSFPSAGFSSSSSQQEFRGEGESRSLTLLANLEREDAAASERVASSLGNIASMQEGLKMKARLCEEEVEVKGEGEEGTRRRSGSLSA